MTIRPPVRELGKGAAIYGLGNVAAKLALLLLIPIYTRFLSMQEVGTLALLETVEFLLGVAVPFGISNALWKALADDPGREREVLVTAFAGTLAVNAVLLGFTTFLAPAAIPFLGLADHPALYFLLLANIFLSFGSRFLLATLQYRGRAIPYAIVAMVELTALVGATWVLLGPMEMGLVGAVVAKSAISGLLFLWVSVTTLFGRTRGFSFRLYRDMLRFASPLILTALVTPILTLSDRFFLKWLDIPLDEIGVYNIAYKCGMVVNMILVMPTQRVWLPSVYKEGSNEMVRAVFADVLLYFSVLGAVLFLCLSLFARNLLTIVALPAYVPGAAFVPWIAMAYLVGGFQFFFTAGAALASNASHLYRVSIVTVAVHLTLNAILISAAGTLGAAASTLISYALFSVLTYRAAQMSFPIDWNLRRIGKMFAILLVIFGIATSTARAVPSFGTVTALGSLFLFPLALWNFGVIGRREMNGIRTLMSFVCSTVMSERGR